MPTVIPPEQIHNLQQIETQISGPDGANRLFIISGQFDTFLGVNGAGNSTATFGVLVGPVFTREQFFRAIATASISRMQLNIQAPQGIYNYGITDIDADWDDESGQLQLKIEVSISVNGPPNNSVAVMGLAFQVSVLAALPAA